MNNTCDGTFWADKKLYRCFYTGKIFNIESDKVVFPSRCPVCRREIKVNMQSGLSKTRLMIETQIFDETNDEWFTIKEDKLDGI